MKGLLLKDFYMANKYLRAFYIVIVVFLVTSIFANNTQEVFFSVFPMFLTGLSVITLLAYEEHSKWNVYSNVLPISRKQFVSEKYIWVLISVIIMSVLSTLVQLVSMCIDGKAVLSGILENIPLLMALGLIGPGIMMPFIFKYGVEKGRIVFYIVAGVLFGGSAMIATVKRNVLNINIPSNQIGIGILIVIMVVFAVSWLVSVKIYEKRDL